MTYNEFSSKSDEDKEAKWKQKEKIFKGGK